jgi:hypothetical protein
MTPVLVLATTLRANVRGEVAFLDDRQADEAIADGVGRKATAAEIALGRVALGEPPRRSLREQDPLARNWESYKPGPNGMLGEVLKRFGLYNVRDQMALDPELARIATERGLWRPLVSVETVPPTSAALMLERS